ncbi:hypothetical protein Hanom_Chr10g00943141 [Helianthus anomalus]
MRDDPFTRKIHFIYLTFYMPSKVETENFPESSKMEQQHSHLC